MQSAGIESRGEFAFYFASWQEAEAEAGRAVADAWEAAHAECQRGLAPMVRDLYRQQRPAVCPSARETSSKSSAGVGKQVKPATRIRVPCDGVVRALASACRLQRRMLGIAHAWWTFSESPAGSLASCKAGRPPVRGC